MEAPTAASKRPAEEEWEEVEKLKEKKRQRRSERRQQTRDGTWPRCLKWMARKKRYCSIARHGESEYCLIHCAESATAVDGEMVERVVCPVDPSHDVRADHLAKHLKKCNVVVMQRLLRDQPYFVQDINSGPGGAVAPPAVATDAAELGAERGGAEGEEDHGHSADAAAPSMQRRIADMAVRARAQQCWVACAAHLRCR